MMNEIDLKTKIEGLEKAIKEHKDFTGTYESQLKETQKQLEDYNKPELTPLQLDNLYEAVESGVNSYDFSDTDNFDVEYGIDYDGKVTLENHEISNSQDLVEAIVEEISKLFKEADAPEDDNS
jgi:predicted RNase H-like nuclease (RuvC/YqgF family)